MSEVRPSKISELQLIIFPNQNILWFDISMDDIFLMDVLDRIRNLINIFGSLQLIKFFIRTFH